jgi:hypothetical protein
VLDLASERQLNGRPCRQTCMEVRHLNMALANMSSSDI